MTKQTKVKESIVLLIAVLLFLVIIGVSTTSIIPAILAGNVSFFNVTLVVGNDNTTIYWVNTTISVTPTEGGISIASVVFNATDTNGYYDIDLTTINLSINRSGVIRSNDTGNCVELANNGINDIMVQCTVELNYYDLPGAWGINITVTDTSGEKNSSNSSAALSYDLLYAMDITNTPMSFIGSTGQSDIAPATSDPIIRNRGNSNYSRINLTAYDLSRQGGSEIISSGNFTINATADSTTGQYLINDTIVTMLDNAGNDRVLAIATDAGDNDVTMYMKLDIPTGTYSGTYNSSQSWVIAVE